MRKYTIDYMKDRLGACYPKSKLTKLWGDKKSLTALEILSLKIPTADKVWFTDCYPIEDQCGGRVYVFTKKIRDKITSKLLDRLLRIIKEELPETRDIISKSKKGSCKNLNNYFTTLRKIDSSICFYIRGWRAGTHRKFRNEKNKILLESLFFNISILSEDTVLRNYRIISLFNQCGYTRYVLGVVRSVLREEEDQSSFAGIIHNMLCRH